VRGSLRLQNVQLDPALEHAVAHIVAAQERYGLTFDCEAAFFALGDWRAKWDLKTISLGRDRKSVTTTREKWLQKRLFCWRAISCGFRKTGWQDIELAAHHAVIELASKSESGTGIFNAETRRKNRVMYRKFVSRDRASQKNWPTCL
jgi:hypothetical protein